MILLMMPVRNEIPLSDDNLMNHAAVRDSKKKTSTFFETNLVLSVLLSVERKHLIVLTINPRLKFYLKVH